MSNLSSHLHSSPNCHGSPSLPAERADKEQPIHGVSIAVAISAARAAQILWAATPLPQRLAVLHRIRGAIAQGAEQLAATIPSTRSRTRADTLVAEVLPLADACRFLEREAPHILAPRRLSHRSRPRWLRGVEIDLHREPLGVILIIAPANYPLFLPGVQALQALVAGNAVLLKPGNGGREPAVALARICIMAGLDSDLVHVLPESPTAAREAWTSGVNKVLLTGSATTGASVLSGLAPHLTPAVCELSGCDAAFVRADADLDLVTQAFAFSLRLNGGATCIAPRRVFVAQAVAAELEARLACAGRTLPSQAIDASTTALIAQALREGARLLVGTVQGSSATGPVIIANASPRTLLLQTDVFAPVLALVTVQNDEQALHAAAHCPYALGATIFGGEAGARVLAAQVRAGVVVINDVIVPTADPRLPFGGRQRSGFGVTRGAEGLRELTAVKAVTVRRGSWRPHLDPSAPQDTELFRTYIALMHSGSWTQRLAASVTLIQTLVARRLHTGNGPEATEI